MGNNNRSTIGTTSQFNFKGLLFFILFIGVVIYMIVGSTENYSEGERIGFITKFSNKGRYWKSWEGELNLTQTGMNTSSLFEFSIDNDIPSPILKAMIDSAANLGWKVKLNYHQVFCKNWFSNRGETDYFLRGVEVLDRHSIGSSTVDQQTAPQGHVIDTVYVVIDKSQLFKK